MLRTATWGGRTSDAARIEVTACPRPVLTSEFFNAGRPEEDAVLFR